MREKGLVVERVARIDKAETQLDRAALPTAEANGGGTAMAANDCYLADRGLPIGTVPTSDGTLNELDRLLYDLSMCPRCRI